MNSPEFQPPVQDYSVVSAESDERGAIVSATVFLHDASGNLFSLHVEGQRADQTVGEDQEDTLEPVFTMPAEYVTEDSLGDVLHDVQPHLLQQYLINQE